ncbi:MAG: putative undecaprenyl-phosphate N-acetylglucosaminyl 1-phosphate transferase [Phycisphaerales bacterium]|nr:putative undecaprenyl-phosphate N-acetylglucosaminyl 1-phosphate transferase [Phycisphaerales bacterium]
MAASFPTPPRPTLPPSDPPAMELAALTLGIISFAIAAVATAAVKRVAPRLNFVDKPGHRKVHKAPTPLGGGVGIFLAFVLPMLGVLLAVRVLDPAAPRLGVPAETWAAYLSGARQQTPAALALLGAAAVLHVMGLVDDKRALGPYVKLLVQLGVAIAVVLPFKPLWSLTALDDEVGAHGALAVTVSVLWITAITNAFNFLDNMDGLSAGIAAVCATSFLITALSIRQWFVAAALALLIGALVGFLCFNFPPASIFMGDAGSLVVGFLLGVLTIRTTYLPPGTAFGAGWYAVFAPVIVLAVPLYDLVVVSGIRLRAGKSPFVGDTNHLSHRLVRRGMSKRTAVLCIWLLTAATSVAAVVLPHAGTPLAAFLLFAQTFLILGVVMLLEQHPLPVGAEGAGAAAVQPAGWRPSPEGATAP